MITHTNIDIGTYRISNSDKEKGIHQTNRHEYSHEHLPFETKDRNMDDAEKIFSENTIID